MWFFKKPKEEVYEQRVYDATYTGTCPICKIETNMTIHKSELRGYDPPSSFDAKTIVECSQCHVALFAKRTLIVTKLKKYLRDEKEVFGLKLVSEEVVKE